MKNMEQEPPNFDGNNNGPAVMRKTLPGLPPKLASLNLEIKRESPGIGGLLDDKQQLKMNSNLSFIEHPKYEKPPDLITKMREFNSTPIA